MKEGWLKDSSITRRHFLGLGAVLALNSPLFRPLGDELPLLLGEPTEAVVPESGEVLPPGLTDLNREDLAASPFDPTQPLFLTFDDGPLLCTNRILDCLAVEEQKATFFVIGRNLTDKRLRQSAVRALAEGHELGNHSFTHPSFSGLSADRATREILKTHARIVEVMKEAGVDPDSWNRFFRFPYGDPGSSWNWSAVRNTLADLGYRIAWWDLDTNDWRMGEGAYGRSPARVIKVMEQAGSRDVVLLHDRNATARLLPRLLGVLEWKKLHSTALSHYDDAITIAANTGQPQQPDNPADNRAEMIPSVFEGLFSRLEKALPPKSITVDPHQALW